MTKEEEVARINLELQYQRILEKITEKMMSRKISQFKKVLLIRIALIMETMAPEDLCTLEDLLERFESQDADVKQMIIDLFQEKYKIDMGTNVQREECWLTFTGVSPQNPEKKFQFQNNYGLRH